MTASDAVEVISGSLEETARLAEELAEVLEGEDAICLGGELGAGKTTFVAALVRALGVEEEVVDSPTFTLENRYPLPPGGRFPEMVHADLYRMGSGLDADLVLSLLEARESGALVVVEWAESVREMLRPCWQMEIRLDRRALCSGETAETLPRIFILEHSDRPIPEGLFRDGRKGGGRWD